MRAVSWTGWKLVEFSSTWASPPAHFMTTRISFLDVTAMYLVYNYDHNLRHIRYGIYCFVDTS